MNYSEIYLQKRLRNLFGNCYRLPSGLPDFMVVYKRQPILIEAKQRRCFVNNPIKLLNATQKEILDFMDFIVAYIDKSNRYKYFYAGESRLYHEVVAKLYGSSSKHNR